MVCLVPIICAGLIGVYFLIRMFTVLLPLMRLLEQSQSSSTLQFFRDIHALSELVAGSGFGLMGLGAYVTQTGVIDATGIAIFVPITILVALAPIP